MLLSSMTVCEDKELALHRCPQLPFQDEVGDELVNFWTTDSWLQLTLNHTLLQIDMTQQPKGEDYFWISIEILITVICMHNRYS